MPMLKMEIEKILEKKSLSEEESFQAGCSIFNGADPAQVASFLALLRAKGETAEELVGLIRAVRSQSKSLKIDRPVLDIAGTGGDQAGTINISTGSALLAARCGIQVLKHGGRSVSSRCGSADVLEALGYEIHLPPEKIEEELERSNFVYCLATDYHPALKKISPIRKGMRIPTVFNLICPLLNPAGADHLQIGVFKPEFVPLIANALFQLGTKRSLVFHGNKLDELSCIGPIEGILVTEKGMEPFRVDPKELGLRPCSLEDLKGGDATLNAALLKKALSGKQTPFSDTLILNAAVALFLFGSVSSLQEGVSLARRKLYGRKSLKEALSQKKGVLAEIKRASPAKGKIGGIANPAERALQYVSGGASAISVLTSDLFEGTLGDLKAVSEALRNTNVPVLRKDFLLRPEQIAESAEHGADIILLIVYFLKEKTKEMLQEARSFGLEAIVEVHNEEELQIALDAGAEIIGVNQRDLKVFIGLDEKGEICRLQRPQGKDFGMHPEIYEKLIPLIPSHLVKIAESGVKSPDDAVSAYRLGYDAVLVGEALTRSEDPAAFISQMRGCHVS